MATRENQGLQAIVIFLSILSLGLLIGVFVVNNMRKTQLARADANETASRNASTAQAQAQAESAELKSIAGFAETDTLEAIREAFGADMTEYQVPEDAESRRYRI